jgi:Xaa-Pro aminopeptidase
MSKVDAIRELMHARGVKAYVVPSTDPHHSEYVPHNWQRRAFVSGFKGSAGDLLITHKDAGLWTDSRYFLEAEAVLQGTGIALFKQGLQSTPDMPTWIKRQLEAGDAVGMDAKLFSHRSYEKLSCALADGGIEIKRLHENLVDLVWTDREEAPLTPILVHPDALAGESVEGKLERTREALCEMGSDALVLSSLDAVAWLYNIRGSDVPYSPVVIAYAVVTRDAAHLFCAPEKVTPALEAHLDGLVVIHDYDDFESHLSSLHKTSPVVTLDPETASQWIVDLLSPHVTLKLKTSPVTGFKAEKNAAELRGMAAAHLRDGAAVTRFLSWLEKAVPKGGVTELSAAAKLAGFRADGASYVGPSFSTISAFGPHGAIVHYEPTEASDVPLEMDGLYLVDSGGQYQDGTTDITRTVALGAPTDEQRRVFTRVLKGHIALTCSAFPAGTAGSQLDTIARKPLWDAGLNYGHGTGHGVGAYLSVHEGPQAISYYRGVGIPLKVGMILSVEPGYYKAGFYGIRIENLVQVVRDETRSTEETTFLTFEPLTLCPIDLSLVEPSLLTGEELDWLDAYHAEVRARLTPSLDSEAAKWLHSATVKVTR